MEVVAGAVGGGAERGEQQLVLVCVEPQAADRGVAGGCRRVVVGVGHRFLLAGCRDVSVRVGQWAVGR
jgi:hypothetical protein